MTAVLAAISHLGRLAWRGRWTFGIPVVTLLLASVVYSLRLPDRYTAKTIVRVAGVRTDSVGHGLSQQGDVPVDKDLATLRDRVLTPENLSVLSAVARQAAPATEADLIALRSQVEFDQVGTAAFSLSVTDTNASTAAQAANRLVEKFLETERLGKLTRAERRRDFCDQEVVRAQSQYDETYRRLEAARSERADALPEDKETLTSELGRIDAQVREREAQAAVARRLVQEYDRLVLQIEATPAPVTASAAVGPDEELQMMKVKGQQAALDVASRELAAARTRYTDRHPTVVQLQREVEELETSLGTAQAALEDARRHQPKDASDTGSRQGVGTIQGLKMMRASAAEERVASEQEAQRLSPRAEALRSRLAKIPATEEVLAPLKRERDERARNVELHQRQADDARALADFYRRGDSPDVTGYAVEIPAAIPSRPSEPNRGRFILVGIGIGLLLGYGLLLLRRKFEEAVVTRAEDVVVLYPEALTVSVPLLGAGQERWRLRLLEGCCAIYVLLCISASTWLMAVHTHMADAPEWVRTLLKGG